MSRGPGSCAPAHLQGCRWRGFWLSVTAAQVPELPPSLRTSSQDSGEAAAPFPPTPCLLHPQYGKGCVSEWAYSEFPVPHCLKLPIAQACPSMLGAEMGRAVPSLDVRGEPGPVRRPVGIGPVSLSLGEFQGRSSL